MRASETGSNSTSISIDMSEVLWYRKCMYGQGRLYVRNTWMYKNEDYDADENYRLASEEDGVYDNMIKEPMK